MPLRDGSHTELSRTSNLRSAYTRSNMDTHLMLPWLAKISFLVCFSLIRDNRVKNMKYHSSTLHANQKYYVDSKNTSSQQYPIIQIDSIKSPTTIATTTSDLFTISKKFDNEVVSSNTARAHPVPIGYSFYFGAIARK